jgi:hypothetical protein
MKKIRTISSANGKTITAMTNTQQRQTYTPLPTSAPGQSATYGASIVRISSPNARQTLQK